MGLAEQRIVIPYSPRPEQRLIHDSAARFRVVVAHRRLGKTVACVNELVKRAIDCTLERPRYAYIAPYRNQAKQVAWDYVQEYLRPIPGADFNQAELRADFLDRRVTLYGADNPDALRGIYLDGAVLDEYADMDPRVWTEVIRPALADRGGWAVFIGTPKGKNAFYDLFRSVDKHKDWESLIFKASETGIVAKGELEDARAVMSEDQYEQEFECSFEAAIQGAYYGKDMRVAEEAGRIASIPWEPKVPVYTAWDLGIGDSTAIWCAQLVGNEIRLIDYYEASGVGLDHYAKILKDKPYVYERHLLPHDGDVKELGTGRSRREVLESLGLKTEIVKNLGVDDGINAVRTILPRCWFDAKKCERGIEALRQYRRAYDDKLKAFRARPLHDWTSHASDAMRYLAVGMPDRSRNAAAPKVNTKWVV